MVASNLERSIELVFGHEGGYINNPKDPGGPTKYGITQRTLSAWREKSASVSDVKNLMLAEASQILRKQYWVPVQGDRLPDGLDHVVFDYAVNSGPAQAIKTLQRVISVEADGVIGARTLSAINGKDTTFLIDTLCDARLSFLRSLKTWRTFGKGWGSRVERVRKEAKNIAKGKASLQCSVPIEGFAVASPSDLKASATGEGKAATIAGIGVLGTACADAANQIAPYTEALPTLRWLFIALTIVGVGAGFYSTLKRIRMSGA